MNLILLAVLLGASSIVALAHIVVLAQEAVRKGDVTISTSEPQPPVVEVGRIFVVKDENTIIAIPEPTNDQSCLFASDIKVGNYVWKKC